MTNFTKAIFLLIFLINHSLLIAQPKNNKTDNLISEYLNKGYDYQMNKNDKLAIDEYEKVIKLDKSNKTAYYNLSLIYANSERQLQAIEIADIALANCTEELHDFYTLKANCLSDIKRFDEALPIYHKALVLEPNDSNLHYNLGYTYFKLQKHESAIIYLKEYIEKGESDEGNYDDGLFYIGTSYLSLKKYTEALEYFNLAINSNPYYTYYFNKVEVLLELNENKEALKVINLAIESNPDKAILFHKRYYVLRSLKQNEKALLDLKKAYSLDPKDGDILLDMGVMYESENNMEQAIKFFEKCIDSKQNLAGAYGNLANIYNGNKLLKDKALIYYQKSINEEPNNANHHYNFGNYYRKIKQFDPAINMYERAIELNPKLTQAYVNLSVIYKEKKEVDKAIEYSLKALELEPDDFDSNANAATFYFEKTDYKNTIKYATKALLFIPKENKSKELLNKRGISRQIIGDYKNALYDYLEIVENYSSAEKKENSGIYSNIGYCYMEDDQLENSKKYFQEAVTYKPEIDQLIGLFTVQYLLNENSDFDETFSKAKKIEKKLKEGFIGIQKLEKEGYFYTEKHKLVLKKIFK